MGVGVGTMSEFYVGGCAGKWEYFVAGEPAEQMSNPNVNPNPDPDPNPSPSPSPSPSPNPNPNPEPNQASR